METKLPKINKILWSVEYGCGEVVCNAGKKNRAKKSGALGIEIGDSVMVLDSSFVDSPRRDLQNLLDAGQLGYWIKNKELSSWQSLKACNTTIIIEEK